MENEITDKILTLAEREQILSKEVLTISDIMKLFSVSKSSAYVIMNQIKFKKDRLGIKSIVHIQDYIEAFGLPQDRFVFYKKLAE